MMRLIGTTAWLPGGHALLQFLEPVLHENHRRWRLRTVTARLLAQHQKSSAVAGDVVVARSRKRGGIRRGEQDASIASAKRSSGQLHGHCNHVVRQVHVKEFAA